MGQALTARLTYPDPHAPIYQGLKALPRTSTSHLTADRRSQPSVAQPRIQLSAATEDDRSNSRKRLRSSLRHDRDDHELNMLCPGTVETRTEVKGPSEIQWQSSGVNVT